MFFSYTDRFFCSTALVIMRESLPRVEKRKERKDVKRRGTGIEIGTGSGIERETRIGGEARTGIGKGTETETEIEKGTEIGTVTAIVITETATGIVVTEGNGAEIGRMMMIITAAGTMIGNMSRTVDF